MPSWPWTNRKAKNTALTHAPLLNAKNKNQVVTTAQKSRVNWLLQKHDPIRRIHRHKLQMKDSTNPRIKLLILVWKYNDEVGIAMPVLWHGFAVLPNIRCLDEPPGKLHGVQSAPGGTAIIKGVYPPDNQSLEDDSLLNSRRAIHRPESPLRMSSHNKKNRKPNVTLCRNVQERAFKIQIKRHARGVRHESVMVNNEDTKQVIFFAGRNLNFSWKSTAVEVLI